MCEQGRHQNNEIVLQSLATDYIEVVQALRTTRLVRGKTCLVSLVRKTAAASAGEPYYQDPGNLYVVVLALNKVRWARLYEELVGHGCGGTLKVNDFTRRGSDAIFFWTEGQVSVSGVFRLENNTPHWLYKRTGQFRAEIRDVDRDGLWEVIEYCLTRDLDEPYYSQIARQGYVLAKQIWKWHRVKDAYMLWQVVPDREGQNRLSPEELLRIPGAKEILRLSR